MNNTNIIVYNIEDLEAAINTGKAAYRARFGVDPCIVALPLKEATTKHLQPGDEFCGLTVDKYWASWGTVQVGE